MCPFELINIETCHLRNMKQKLYMMCMLSRSTYHLCNMKQKLIIVGDRLGVMLHKTEIYCWCDAPMGFCDDNFLTRLR